jgi:hypothetical protein
MSPTDYQTLLLHLIHLDGNCLQQAAVRSLNASDWKSLSQLALSNDVFPQLYARLKEPGLACWTPPDVLDDLKQVVLRNVVRNMQIGLQLRDLLIAFNKAMIPVIVLKGAYLAEHVYETPAQRGMSDIDLLVMPGTQVIAQKILHGLGYRGARLHWAEPCGEDSLSNERPFVRHSYAAAVDLHWRLAPSGFSPRIDEGQCWERSRTVLCSGVSAKVLSPEDFLLHLCFHISYHHEFRVDLRALLDLAVFCRHLGHELDWQALVNRAVAWRLDPGLCLCLVLAKQMLGAPIPEAPLADLGHRAPSALIEMAIEEVVFGGTHSGFRRWLLGFGPLAVMRMGGARLKAITYAEIADFYDVAETTPWFVRYYLRYVLKCIFGNCGNLARIAVGGRRTRIEMDNERLEILREYLRSGGKMPDPGAARSATSRH